VKTFADTPHRDWTTDITDAARYMAIVARHIAPKAPPKAEPRPGVPLRSLAAALNGRGIAGARVIQTVPAFDKTIQGAYGFRTTPATLIKKYIQNGSVQDIWWNVKDLGYLTYYGAQLLAQCKHTGKEGESFKAARLGDYKVGAKVEVVLGPRKS